MSNPEYNPFFIVGHPRSGTTLLRIILCGHSNIFVPEESGFIPFLRVNPAKPLNKKEVEDIIQRIGELNYLWRNVPIPAEQIYSQLSEPTLAALLDFVYRLQIKPHNSTRWGDKTPLYVQYMNQIGAIFPNAQFIHLIRDGRDAALSARTKWGKNSIYMDLDYLLRNWVRNVSAGRRVGQTLNGNQYLEIRYEDLVKAPEKIVREVCNFLKEPYEPDMLEHTRTARLLGPGPDDHYEILEPISTQSVGRWKIEFTFFDIKKSSRIAGDLLTKLGYEVRPIAAMTFPETMKYWLTTSKYYFFDIIRSILYKSGFLTLNKTMRKQK